MEKMRELVGRRRFEESGFTLIEMLIVVGIIVALAAAIVPQVVQFGGSGEEGDQASELATIQTAMDSMMDDVGIDDIQTRVNSENDWVHNVTSSDPAYDSGTETTTLQNYLRVTSTTWFYCWTTAGKVSQKAKTTAAC